MSKDFDFRQYAWYSPELNAIVFQTIASDCHIGFHWDQAELYYQFVKFGADGVAMQEYLWFPLGEV